MSPQSGSSFASLRSAWIDPAIPDDTKLGRELAKTPPWLTLALYVPQHDSNITHLPIYDVSSQYHQATKDLPVGSSQYKVNLILMEKPSGDGAGGNVRYLADFSPLNTPTVALRRRTLSQPATEMKLEMPLNPEEAFTITAPCGKVSVPVSFPIPATVRGLSYSRNPYFTFSVPSPKGPTLVQWQIHPVEHGFERYTLVRLDSPELPEERVDRRALAIYYHIGIALSLSESPSQGVLLLPQNQSPILETLIVASLLGLLWQVRAMGKPEDVDSCREQCGSIAGVMKAMKSTFSRRRHSLCQPLS